MEYCSLVGNQAANEAYCEGADGCTGATAEERADEEGCNCNYKYMLTAAQDNCEEGDAASCSSDGSGCTTRELVLQYDLTCGILWSSWGSSCTNNQVGAGQCDNELTNIFKAFWPFISLGTDNYPASDVSCTATT